MLNASQSNLFVVFMLHVHPLDEFARFSRDKSHLKWESTCNTEVVNDYKDSRIVAAKDV